MEIKKVKDWLKDSTQLKYRFITTPYWIHNSLNGIFSINKISIFGEERENSCTITMDLTWDTGEKNTLIDVTLHISNLKYAGYPSIKLELAKTIFNFTEKI